MHISEVTADLLAEQAALDAVVAALDEAAWSTDTASPRWDVTDQIAHLTYFDRAAATAIRDADEFALMAAELQERAGAGDVDQLTLGAVRELRVDERLEAWRAGRRELAAAADTLADDARVAWYGPSMGSKSFLTARLMECWAHGQDIVDAVGAARPPTDRLRHIAQLGFITRGWTYLNRGLDIPDTEVSVVLTGPGDDEWRWGPNDAPERVTGPAEDFCLVVTQRRHLADTALRVEGDGARDWLEKAQAFAGPPTDGPSAGGRR